MMDEQPPTETAQSAHKRTFRFVYRHSLELVAVSVMWFVASLPVVTLGPATLGAYAAVRSLRQTGHVDRAYVARALGMNGIHAALLSFLPLAFVVSATLYLGSGGGLGGFENVAAVVGIYVGGYLGVALIPTFYALADGETPLASLKQGYVWVATKPTSTVTLALVTGTLFVVTALMTVGFVLLFPALTISYHVEVLADEPAEGQGADTPTGRPEALA
ncbi:hypothetical protein SAMN04487948_10718 [Halogranum amylolyticum]|uniref:Uncharacterized protein n=1 Tax=Halogranum amylolyticum TaxID=660520 RepID=A0A1H8TGK3_9EURY|nr:hypothetical protein [Halogranum amylolyticum]SEO89945.1 hypothetical protein SAMN04487948_10718 [Halogranum amylolyticum]